MPVTVIVRTAETEARLTFDGMQRVVIGRGASCDVRLPDPTVSHRHACLRAKGVEFVLFDEGSTNGTFVGAERVAAHTSRVVRSGDAVRVGRVWLELVVDQSPVTRDVAGATRDLALELVSRALAESGGDLTMRLLVLEGPDQGTYLPLADEGRSYLLGRDKACDLALSDRDASRNHARVERRGDAVFVTDLGAKNGTWIAGSRAPQQEEVPWRPTQVMRIARTVLGLEEPVALALARIEGAPDALLPEREAPQPPPNRPAPPGGESSQSFSASGLQAEKGSAAPIAMGPATQLPDGNAATERRSFSITDVVVIGAAISVIAMSVAGLIWLLRG